jgi:hypothetical protein
MINLKKVCALFTCALILSWASTAGAAQKTATFTGADVGDPNSYNDPDNWDIAEVPINNVTDTFVVIIPGGFTVNYDVPQLGASTNQVDSITVNSASTLNYQPSRALNATTASINMARIDLTTGSATALPTTLYDTTRSGNLLTADGASTVLDLSATTTLTRNNIGGSPSTTIATSGGALIDFGGLTTITNNSTDDLLRFTSTSGGTYDFTNLTTITGPVEFNIDAAAFSLPALQSITGGFTLTRTAGSTTTLAALLSSSGGTWNVPAGGSITANTLTQLRNTTVQFAGGGSLNTPALVDIQGSFIKLDSTSTFNHGGLFNIDDAKFELASASLTVSAGNYRSDGTGTIISVDGATATLDMSSVTSWTQNNLGGTPNRTVSVINDATLDLSNLTSITNNSGDDTLIFRTQSGGSIDFMKLQSVVGPVTFDFQVPNKNLPALETFNTGTWLVDDNSTLAAPELTQLINTTVTIGDGGTLTLPKLDDVTGSTLNLGPNQTFTHAGLSDITSTRFLLSGGATLTPTAGTYTSDNTGTIISVDGSTTLLDMSSLSTWVQNNFGGTFHRTVLVTSNGTLDLSNLTTLTNNSTDDHVIFRTQTGGTIDLASLQTVVGPVTFDFQQANKTLPALVDFASGTWLVNTSSTLSAPLLTTLTQTTITIGNGGTLDTPMLDNVDGSTINLGAGQTFNHNGLASISSTRFFLTGGANLASTATAYASDSTGTIISVDGNGTLLDLSSVAAWTQVNYGGTFHRTVLAQSMGKIDLSGVQTVTNNSPDDQLRFTATSGGDHRPVRACRPPPGAVVFNIDAQSSLKLGDFTVTPNVTININDVTSSLDVAGSLLLDTGAVINVATGGAFSVGGNYAFSTTTEANADLSEGGLNMDGSGSFAAPQFLEVGSEDLGLPSPITDPTAIPGTDGNFAVGQLTVGTVAQTTIVELRDLIDNGNRSSLEAIYLPGLGSDDGLKILSGSTLVINSINVYAFLDGEWKHLNPLFTGGITQIALNTLTSDPAADGFVAIPEPTTAALLAIGGVVLMRRKR